MTNEAKLWIETGLPIPFTVSNATGIEKGTLCTMTDPMTATSSSATAPMVAGIAASEKIASDGKVRLGIYREGYFKVLASGGIPVGAPVGIAGDAGLNYVYSISGTSGLSGSPVLGIAMETATDEQTLIIQVKPQGWMDSRD